MTPLTGAGEQRGAEVIDEQSGTLPPRDPSADGDGPDRGSLDRGSPSEQTTIQIPAQHAVDGIKRPPVLEATGAFLSSHGPIVKKVALGVAVCLVGTAGFAGLRKIADAPADPGAVGNSAQTPGGSSSTPDDVAEGVRRNAVGQAVLQKMAEAIKTESRVRLPRHHRPAGQDVRRPGPGGLLEPRASCRWPPSSCAT